MLALAAHWPAAANTTASYPLQQILPGSYSAVLDRSDARWHLLELDGSRQIVEILGCGEQAQLPSGLWLLSRGKDGRSRLLAPSATVLPEGHPAELTVVACGEAGPANALQLPSNLLNTLENRASAILVRD